MTAFAGEDTLESRIRRLEGRAFIGEQVIKYALAVDRRDWDMFADCFTDPVYVDYSENGVPAADLARDDVVALVRDALETYTASQHLSTNHIIEFDERDPDRAICYSSMFAQHHSHSPEGDELFVLRGSYTNHMSRTARRWRIERLIQHISWGAGS